MVDAATVGATAATVGAAAAAMGLAAIGAAAVNVSPDEKESNACTRAAQDEGMAQQEETGDATSPPPAASSAADLRATRESAATEDEASGRLSEFSQGGTVIDAYEGFSPPEVDAFAAPQAASHG